MSVDGLFLSEAVERLGRCDPTLETINLFFKEHTDAELAELVDCLLAHPNVVTRVNLRGNQLTDQMGVKLARYVAASSTIQRLNLSHNQFTEATYLAVAAALRVNSSLRELHLFDNQAVDRTRVEAAFVKALRLNPSRPAESMWLLYSGGYSDIDFERLKHAADELGHPSLLALLC